MGIQRWVASNDLIDFLRRKNTSKSQKNSQVNEKEEKNSSKAFVKRGKIYECCLVSSAVALKLKCMCWRWRLTFSSRKLFFKVTKNVCKYRRNFEKAKNAVKIHSRNKGLTFWIFYIRTKHKPFFFFAFSYCLLSVCPKSFFPVTFSRQSAKEEIKTKWFLLQNPLGAIQ